jgi:cation:H+ antiporter
MIWDVFYIVIGLGVLIAGGEFLVKGAVGVAAKARLSTLVIGMTVVSFGTSAPELFVSLKAAYLGSPEIVVGNVLGSNIANIALVLGLTVLIFPMPVSRNSIRFDWPMMMLSGVLFFLFSYNLLIVFWEGLVLFLILTIFIWWLIRNSRRKNKSNFIDKDEMDEEVKEVSNEILVSNKSIILKSIAYLFLGLVGLYFGARWLINGASNLGESFGLSKHIIAITIVAFGTSVPELVTSVVAAYKKEMDISVGNLIGSNIFNVMAVLAITAMIKPVEVEHEVVMWDMIWMLLIFLALLPMMLYKRKIGRISGIILLGTYFTYIYLLF